MTKVIIKLEYNQSNQPVYFPNHLLKGTVELSLSEKKKFRGFYVNVHGQARCHWSETRSRGSGKNRTTYTVHFEGKEIYLNSRTYLFGRYGGDSMEILPGVHKYDFACQLPELLPGSFGGAHGQIEYYVEAVVDVPWGFDKETKVPFTVARLDDFSIYPELRVPMKQEEIKRFCCLFCESEPLYISASVPKAAFATGENIPINVTYANKSDVKITSTRFKLRRCIYFNATTPETKTKYSKEAVVESHGPGVNPASNNEFQAGLAIPAILPTSNERFCRVIQVSYQLAVIAVSDGECHKNVEMVFPITLGNVVSQPSVAPQPATAPSIGYPSAVPSAPVEKDPLVDLPPSFDEAVNMAKPQVAPMPQTGGSVGWSYPNTSSFTAPSAPTIPSAPIAPPEKM